MNRNCILSLGIVLAILLPSIAQGQDITISCPQIKGTCNEDRLQQEFSEYIIFRPDDPAIMATLYDKSQVEFTLTIEALFSYPISLTKTTLLSEDYNAKQLPPGRIDHGDHPYFQTYKGNIIGDPTSQIRLSIKKGLFYGFIRRGSQTLWIEPANTFDSSIDSSIMIAYYESHVVRQKHSLCMADKVQQQSKRTEQRLKSTSDCKTVDLAIAMDYSYITDPDHNSLLSAIQQTLHIMNLVEGNYENVFEVDIEFDIVEHYAPSSATEGQALWGSSLEASVLLTNFSSWAPQGFTQDHDIGQFWTSGDIYYVIDPSLGDIPSNRGYGVAGLAWVNSVCSNNRYHILEEYTSTDWPLRVLTAHELGHNFGAIHDLVPGHIMSSIIIGNTNAWSPASKTSINGALNNFTCLENCLTGSCSTITAIETSGCTPGSPTTYDLHITISHAGGGSSSGFSVYVNDKSFPFEWSTSPQKVTINHLPVDHAAFNIVYISADDGSDIACRDSTAFDPPLPSCDLKLVEDFNDCKLPSGWQSLTDNRVSINGGDPQYQYQWKFDDGDRYILNYDNADNANTTKTIDSTCMALMDDDINSASFFEGIVTLKSPPVNTLDYSRLSVAFDYNFHNFEDGKSPNDSYFKVDIWDGNAYINLLTVDEDSCPWTNVWPAECTSHFTADISIYSNSDLHCQFVYSDGSNQQWTGMIALDNFQLMGNNKTIRDLCRDNVTLPNMIEGGTFEANNSIIVTEPTVMSGYVKINAPEIDFYQGVEVLLGTTLTLTNEGCNAVKGDR